MGTPLRTLAGHANGEVEKNYSQLFDSITDSIPKCQRSSRSGMLALLQPRGSIPCTWKI